MKCIQVILNDKLLWTIGHEEVADLLFHLTYAPSVATAHISANGVFSSRVEVNESEPWEQLFIKEGDVVTLQIVESDKPNVSSKLKEFDAAKGDLSLYCSFCGKSQNAVSKLVAGSNAYICNECIENCVDIVRT